MIMFFTLKAFVVALVVRITLMFARSCSVWRIDDSEVVKPVNYVK